MNKFALTIGAALAVSTMAIAAPTQAHWRSHGPSHAHKAYDGHTVRHRHVRNLNNRKYRLRAYRAKHKHPARFKNGMRPDCAMLARRAFLTNNTYWKYATYECRTTIYKGEYK